MIYLSIGDLKLMAVLKLVVQTIGASGNTIDDYEIDTYSAKSSAGRAAVLPR